MSDKFISASKLRELLGIDPDCDCDNCSHRGRFGCRLYDMQFPCKVINDCPAADVLPIPDSGIGEMSDGYHTFNGLYHQRMMLFAALVKAYKDKAWKSYKHEDGELCFGGGWFIVGIDTPEGSYTYHYESKDFDLFDCVELPVAKHWDGHTEADVGRLMSLDVRSVMRGKWILDRGDTAMCSNCGNEILIRNVPGHLFCPNCGADMRKAQDGN